MKGLTLSMFRWVGIMVFNATFNNISVISWRSVLFVGETGVPAFSMFIIMLLPRLTF